MRNVAGRIRELDSVTGSHPLTHTTITSLRLSVPPFAQARKAMEFVSDDALLEKTNISAGITNTNILSDPEWERVKNLIHDTEGLLSSLDQEIERLIARRADAAERFSKLRVAVAPHKRLPPEILSAIFLRVVDNQSLRLPPLIAQPHWDLRQVCSTWRSVALNEPRLWNSIEVNTDGMDSKFILPLPEIIHYILLPTGPISISFKGDDFNSAHIINRVIMPNVQRIKDLAMFISLETFVGFLGLLRTPEIPFSSLEYLRLDLTGGSQSHITGWQEALAGELKHATGFQLAPGLKRLHFSYGNHSLSSKLVLQIPLPWTGLTSLRLTTLQSLTIPNVNTMLRRCPLLVTLIVTLGHEDMASTTASTESFDLPHLRHVQLDGYILGPVSLLDLQIPWNQLVTVDFHRISDISLVEGYNILRECTQLEELSIPELDHGADSEIPTEVIRLTHLRHLMVEIDTSHDILHILTVPALETFLLNGSHIPTSAVSAMILRSGCMLSKFGSDGSAGNIDHLLSNMHSVSDFDVPNVDLDPQEMHDIASGLRLPLMQRFSCCLRSPLSFPLFLAMLERGRKQGTPSEGTRAAAALLKATGYYLNEFGPEYASAICRMNEHLGKLNEEYGTDFKLMSWSMI